MIDVVVTVLATQVIIIIFGTVIHRELIAIRKALEDHDDTR